MTPANRPEDEATPALTRDMARQGLDVDHLLIDRGYINSTLVDALLARRGTIVCKPWRSHTGMLCPQSAFTLNLRNRTIACPTGQVQRIAFGSVGECDADVCDRCALRSRCTTAALGQGRSVAIAENEPLQHRLRGATSAFARTPSTSAARTRSKTWRRGIGQKSIRDRRRRQWVFV